MKFELKWVFYREREFYTDEKMDRYVSAWMEDLHKFDVELCQLAENQNIEQYISLHKNVEADQSVCVSATDQLLNEAADMGIATIGYLNSDYPEQGYDKAQILVEGFEEVDYYFVERIYQRKHHVPWRVIDTKRCYLKEMTVNDLDDLYQLYAGKDMTKYMEPLYENRNEEYEYTKAYVDNQYWYYGYGMWLVMDRNTDELIGRAGLNNQEIHGEVELEMGYAISKELQNQGYGTEVCLAIIEYAKEYLEFERINCLVQKENAASVRLLEKLGFHWVEELNLDCKKMQRYILAI